MWPCGQRPLGGSYSVGLGAFLMAAGSDPMLSNCGAWRTRCHLTGPEGHQEVSADGPGLVVDALGSRVSACGIVWDAASRTSGASRRRFIAIFWVCCRSVGMRYA